MTDRIRTMLRRKTLESFDYQWRYLPSGTGQMSDTYFRENVVRILCEEELCINSEWFKGKEVLDAGCGIGRWTYGFLQLGARVTALDAASSACDTVREKFGDAARLEVVKADILRLPEEITNRHFDLVFSWGVLHHTGDLRGALESLCRLVKPDGLVYVYLYGRDSLTWSTRLKIGLARSLLMPLSAGSKRFVLSLFYPGKVLHSMFDMLAPTINERVEEQEVKDWLREAGFDRVLRTIEHSELFLKAWRSGSSVVQYFREPIGPPYRFERLTSSATPTKG